MELETLCHDLAVGADIFRSLIAGVTLEQARARPAPDSWSILEVICHLYDEEREDFRQRLDIILHRPGEKWPPIDPRGWVTARGYNVRDLDEMAARFLDERQKSLEWLSGLSVPDWNVESPAPWGIIRAGDMLSSWVAHDNLHMRQLVELRRSRLLSLAEPYDVQYAGDW